MPSRSRRKTTKTRSANSPAKAKARAGKLPTAKDFSAIAARYCEDVTTGRIPACKWIRIACQRFLDDLLDCASPESPYIYSKQKAHRAGKFIEMLPHTKGVWRQRREAIVLQGWQCFVICAVFGFLHRESGLRRCREMFLLLPRKSGKSLFAAAIALYMTCADGEAFPEVYCGARTLRQALEVFTPAKQMVRIQPALKSAFHLQIWSGQLLLEAGGKFMPVVRDPGEGQSPSCYVMDEVHQHLDDTLISCFRTGCAAREQPLGVFISTAGSSIEGPCYAMVEETHKVLDGTFDRPELFALLYGIDEGDDWTSEETLRKANPGWGVSIFPEFLRTQQKNAIANARLTNSFLTRHLNVWVGTDSAYFNVAKWNALGNPDLKPEDFAGCPSYLGIDLSSKIDLTAVVKVFKRTGDDGKSTYGIFPRFYLPEDRVNDPALAYYAGWEKSGYLTATKGSMVDYDLVTDDAVQDIEQFAVCEIAIDQWNAGSTINRLAKEATSPVVEIPQTTRFLSDPTKTLEALILDGRVEHDGNPVLAWCIGNTVCHEDRNGNVKPNKPKDRKQKIDGVVATLMALSRALLGNGGEPQAQGYFTPLFI